MYSFSSQQVRETSDGSLMTVTAVKNRITRLAEQGLGDTPRALALACRLPAGHESNAELGLLPLPKPASKPRIDVAADGDGMRLVMPSGKSGSVGAIAGMMGAFQRLVDEGKVTVKATVYKNYKGGIGEGEYANVLSKAGVPAASYYLNETEQTKTAKLLGAYTGEVIIHGADDKALAEIEPFLSSRGSTKRHEGKAMRVYNNPLFLVSLAMGAGAAA